MTEDSPIRAVLNKSRLKAVTVYGAIGLVFHEPVFMIAKATTKVETDRFVLEMAGKLRNPYSSRKVHLVADNHRSHIYCNKA